MISKAQRLSRSEFSSVFERGKRIHSDAFSLIYSPAEGDPKASVVVSKKIAGNIISRNFLRRRLYEVLKTELVFDSILLAKKGVKDKSFKELVEEYKNLLRKAK